jgi:hypothetical protein
MLPSCMLQLNIAWCMENEWIRGVGVTVLCLSDTPLLLTVVS